MDERSGSGPMLPVSTSGGSASQRAPGVATALVECLDQIQENHRGVEDAEARLQVLLTQRESLASCQHRLEQGMLLEVLQLYGHALGCHHRRPVAAVLLFRCCLRWGMVDGSSDMDAGQLLDVLSSLIIESAETENPDQVSNPAGDSIGPSSVYWMATCCTLLELLRCHERRSRSKSSQQQTLAPNALQTSGAERSWKPAWARGLLSKMSGEKHDRRRSIGRASDLGGAAVSSSSSSHTMLSSLLQPMRHLQQQLAVLEQQAHDIVYERLKRQLVGLVPGCLQACRGMATDIKTTVMLGDEAEKQETTVYAVESSVACAAPAASATLGAAGTSGDGHRACNGLPGSTPDGRHAASTCTDAPEGWSQLVTCIDTAYHTLAAAGVPDSVARMIIGQLLDFLDVQLFNQLLLRPECCSSSNAQCMERGLERLDAWVDGLWPKPSGMHDGQEPSGPTCSVRTLNARPLLQHTREALSFLAYVSKGKLSLDAIVSMCPSLTLQQLYRLCTTFWDDTEETSSGDTQSASHSMRGCASSLASKLVMDAEAAEVATTHGLESGGGSAAAAQTSPVYGLVSGELLEALKQQAHVSSNGGLIVTFLLDDVHPQDFSTGHLAEMVSGAPDSDTVHHSCELLAGIPLPPQLVVPGDRQPFAFLELDLHD